MDNMKDELRECRCHCCNGSFTFNAKYNDSWYEKPNHRTKINEGEVVCSEPIATGSFNSKDGRKTEYYTIVRCPNCNKLNKVIFNE